MGWVGWSIQAIPEHRTAACRIPCFLGRRWTPFPGAGLFGFTLVMGGVCIYVFLIRGTLGAEVRSSTIRRLRRDTDRAAAPLGWCCHPPPRMCPPAALPAAHLSCAKPPAAAEQREVRDALPQESTLQKQQVQLEGGKQVLGD